MVTEENISIVQATEKHLDLIANLVEQTRLDYLKKGINQWDETYPKIGMLKSDIINGYSFIINYRSKFAGFVTVNDFCEDDEHLHIDWLINEKSTYIHRLCISEEMRNKGIATYVIKYIENSSFELGVYDIRIDVFKTNKTALALYEKLGYIRIAKLVCSRGNYYAYEKVLKK